MPDRLSDSSDEAVAKSILNVIESVQVVTERELKIRLEKQFFPWMVGRVLGSLIRSKSVCKYGYPGRRKLGRGAPQYFYMLSETRYDDVMALMQQKRLVTTLVNAQLTAESVGGLHAENLFEDALEAGNFRIVGRDVSEYRGRQLRGVEGKEPPNLDFVAARDGVEYGIDIKNWLYYEVETVEEVKRKVSFAVELNLVPWVIARYIDKDTIYKEVYRKGGIVYPYGRLLLPAALESLAVRARTLLGYPVFAVDVLPEYVVSWLSKLHVDLVKRRS